MKIPNTNINIKNITQSLKNLSNENMKTKMIGLLTILLLLWSTLYLIPEIFVSLFNTLLGNLLLIVVSIVTLLYNTTYGILISLILIIIYRFQKLSNTNIKNNFKEGFTADSVHNFLEIQNTINPNIVFDTTIIQNQATQEELDYFNANGIWPWSQETKDLYVKNLNTNPYIRTYSPDELNYVMTIYNESAIKVILYNQSTAGQLKINGVLVPSKTKNSLEALPNGFGDFPYTSGLQEDRTQDLIKCDLTNETLERTVYTGKGGIYGEQTSIKNPVDYNNLESIVPGLKFLNGPCNPCQISNSSQINNTGQISNTCQISLH